MGGSGGEPPPGRYAVAIVAGLSGAELGTVSVPRDFDVADLKWEIEVTLGIPDQEQRLVLETRVLANTESLQDVFGAGGAQVEIRLIRLDRQWVETLRGIQAGRLQLRDVDERVRNDREVVLAAVRRDPTNLRHLSEDMRDREVVLVAVSVMGKALQHASAAFRADRDVVLAAVRSDGLAVRFAVGELRSDMEIALAAVRQNGWALELVHEDLRADRELVLAAVTQEGQALKHAAAELQSDRELVLAAVSSNAEALRYIPPELKQDAAVVRAASMGVRMRGFGGLQYFQNLLL